MNYIDLLAQKVKDELAVENRPGNQSAELYRVYALLVLSKGQRTSLRDVHNAWSVWMAPQKPEHSSLIPFEELSEEQREQDAPYRDAIIRVAKATEEPAPENADRNSA